MALFGFTTRGPQRDRETGESGVQRLRQSLAYMRAEMECERNGLRDRYDKVAGDAAFSQQLLEDERGGLGLSSKVGHMTGTMIGYSRRIALLQAQIDFVVDLERKADTFSKGRAFA